jgi:hypothetical protein
MIARRLVDHVMGKVELSATQVTAALGLLKKTLPDLNATEFTGELRHRDISDEPLTAEQWEQQYADSLAAAERSPEKSN